MDGRLAQDTGFPLLYLGHATQSHRSGSGLRSPRLDGTFCSSLRTGDSRDCGLPLQPPSCPFVLLSPRNWSCPAPSFHFMLLNSGVSLSLLFPILFSLVSNLSTQTSQTEKGRYCQFFLVTFDTSAWSWTPPSICVFSIHNGRIPLTSYKPAPLAYFSTSHVKR